MLSGQPGARVEPGPARSYRWDAVGLLERNQELATLAAQLDQVSVAGRLVLITGEAGAGKSALVQEFCRQHAGHGRVLFGQCDDLFAPRPFGPVADIARDHHGPLSAALATGDQPAIFDAFIAEISAPPHPVVVVLEDLQWADEATLDLLRFVARRLEAQNCLILATHRVDLTGDHPLRRASGSLIGPNVTRLQLAPLSLDAVRIMAAAAGGNVDAESLHARTGGNPFFVTELLGSEPRGLPATVRDTVVARATHLSGAARDALDAAAVLGRATDVKLIMAVGGCDIAAVDECVEAGLLIDDGAHFAFRHDLSRQAVEAVLTPLRRRQLHGRALDAMGEDGDVVQRANHAIESGDGPTIIRLATRAADRCVNLGAYREAATLYASALTHATGINPAARRRLLEATAMACERVERFGEAIAAGEEILATLDSSSDAWVRGGWECWLGSLYRVVGRAEDAWRMLRAAVVRFEPLGDSPEMARALGMLAQHQMVSGHSAEAIVTGRRAQAMAEQFGAEDIAVHAMDSYGVAMTCCGDERGLDVLREALDRAKRSGVHHEVTRISSNLSSALLLGYEPVTALAYLDHGLGVAVEHELHFMRNCLLNERARALFLLGRWDEVGADIRTMLDGANVSDTNRCCAVLHLGRVRARRGDPGADEALDESLALALPFAEMQMIHPVYIARAEAAWLSGDQGRAAKELEAAVPFSDEHPEPWYLGELALWARRTGVDWTPRQPMAEPFTRVLAGDLRGAAAYWDGRGCRYEAADALADSDDEADLRLALEWMNELGGRPRAQMVMRRLREIGARGVPRGPRPKTRGNPAGLTARELEVAGLLARGLANSEIAERLVLSPKTVDHHVSAVLAKLSVRTRRQVAMACARVGLELEDGEPAGPR